MIPVMQTKVVVTNSTGHQVRRGNCYAAAIASILELPIEEVPNIETLFDIPGSYSSVVMLTFLTQKGWDLCSDDRYRVFHPDLHHQLRGWGEMDYDVWLVLTKSELQDHYYLVSGPSPRGNDISHICIYKNGHLVHDPHPTKEGLLELKDFTSLQRIK